MGELTSHAGIHPRLRAADRLDPYWEGLWSSGSTASWVNVNTARMQEAAGLARMPRHLQMDAEQAWQKWTSPRGWRERLEVLGLLGSWRTLSAQQLAAFAGNPALARHSVATDAALIAGLLDQGVFTSGLVRTRLHSTAKLLRPASGDVFDEKVAPLLTYPEQVLVTGGRPWSGGGQFDRHNLLTAELALRVAEFCDVGTVLGESLATVDDVAGAGIGKRPIEGRRAADALFIRGDGMRIAVELTASVTPYFTQKVENWAQLLTENSMASSGLTVLFIGAPKPDRDEERRFAKQMRTAVARAVRKYPGIPGRRAADRLGVAMWTDFFPAVGKVGSDFLTLRCWRPEGPKGAPWVQAGMLDFFDTPFEPLDGPAMEAVISNSASIASAPVWLRRGKPELALHEVALRQAGFDQIPTPIPRDKRHRGTFVPGQFRGPGKRAKVPARLRNVPPT